MSQLAENLDGIASEPLQFEKEKTGLKQVDDAEHSFDRIQWLDEKILRPQRQCPATRCNRNVRRQHHYWNKAARTNQNLPEPTALLL